MNSRSAVSSKPRALRGLAGAAGLLAISLGGPAAWAVDICKASDVKAILDATKETAEYKDCELEAISGHFASSATALLDGANLLEDLYRQVEKSYVPNADEPLPQDGYTYAGDIGSARAKITWFHGLDWTVEGTAAWASSQMELSNTHLQRLVGKISALSSDQVGSEQRYSFCKVLLEWKRSQHWRKRFDICQAD